MASTPWVLSLFIFVLNGPVLAQVPISEAQVMALAEKENPSLQKIESARQQAHAEKAATGAQYDPKLTGQYSYFSSNENAIIQFAPVFKPQKLATLGVSKKSSLGMTFDTQLYSQQISTANGFINNATQTGVAFGVEIDIWKNFLGGLDRSRLNSADYNKKISNLQSEIARDSFLQDVRKTYWSLVANEMSLELSKELVKTAKKQFSESRQKLKEGLGDSGDVARNQAQLQSRESSVLFFSFQREQLIGVLKSLLPGLKGESLAVNPKESIQIEAKARQCMNRIVGETSVNPSYSRMDEIITLLSQQQEHEVRLANATDAMDLKLQARYQASGVDNSHSEAWDRLANEFRNGYQVGVALNVPLGGDISDAKRATASSIRNRFEAEKNELGLKLNSEHEKVRRAIAHLMEATLSQDATVTSLKTSMKQTQRKFRQARVSLNTYILEQDNLFGSELQLIETKLRVLHLLLDYFKIFNQHPCQINQSMGAQS